MLTARGKYGLKAVAYLAGLPPEASARSSEMAAADNISKKFLDAILADLRDAGIVTSKKGPGGGYRLARKPQKISVAEVIRVLDGPLAPIGCASRTAYRPCKDCVDVRRCQVRITMTKVRDAMSSILDGMTVQSMVIKPKTIKPKTIKPKAIKPKTIQAKTIRPRRPARLRRALQGEVPNR